MDQARLENMEPQALTEALSDYLDGVSEEDFDPSVMSAYLDALEERAPQTVSFDPRAAELIFRERHRDLLPAADLPPAEKTAAKGRGWRLVRRAAAVAAAMALTTALAAQSMGVDLFGSIARWSKGEFVFSTGSGAGGPSGYVDHVWGDGASYSNAQAALDAYQVSEPMVPMWNPPASDSGEIPGLEVSVTEGEDGVLTVVEDHRTSSGSGYTFEVRAWNSPEEARSGILGAEEPDTIVYTFGGRTYYILPGDDGASHTVTWAADRYSGKVYGDMDLETAKHFARSVTEQEEVPYEPPDMSLPPEYGTIQEAAAAAGIAEAYAPTWLPDGFVPVESNVYRSESADWRSAYLFYTDVEGERNLSVSLDQNINPDSAGATVFPKDDTPIETYERGGVTFYLISNLGWRSIAWVDGSLSGAIGGNLTVEECRQIIDSIPRYAQ